MSTHPIPDLLSLWAKGDLTADQATLTAQVLRGIITMGDLTRRAESG